MGVPKFFRWISERYPLISTTFSGNLLPDFDNFYLDMNSIIHACTHSNDGDGDLGITEDQMFIRIFNYIENLFLIIKPKKVFFMAIDGVAPRAKMNEQRARRFRKILESERHNASKKSTPEPGKEKTPPFDSNSITPGTEFMEKLSICLKYFVHKKITEDKDWQSVKVVYSGYDVPGEGEHKIMDFIRYERSLPNSNPNTRHCMYGLDADLIMLGLCSHEPHFTLLREVVTFTRASERRKQSMKSMIHESFILLNLSLFREYLDLEFSPLKNVAYPEGDAGYDTERVIDDYILICMLAGNDFMKHLPGLHIGEGVISMLIRLYIGTRPQLGGYLHDNGKLDLERMQTFLRKISVVDIQLFETDMDGQEWFEAFKYIKSQDSDGSSAHEKTIAAREEILHLLSTFAQGVLSLNDIEEKMELLMDPNISQTNFGFISSSASKFGLYTHRTFNSSGDLLVTVSNFSNPVAADSDESEIDDPELVENPPQIDSNLDTKVNIYELSSKDITTIKKSIKVEDNLPALVLNEAPDYNEYEYEFENWKLSYYTNKLGIDYNVDEVLSSKTESLYNMIPVRLPPPQVAEMCRSYLGIFQWVLVYYFRGLQCWRYYYPYHYSPRISDLLTGLSSYTVDEFPKDVPFTPLEQLMFVLPPGSSPLIPHALRPLMLSPLSPIFDLFPKSFETDLNGKKNDWEAVVLIEFVDTDRIIAAMKPYMSKLTSDEKHRNKVGSYVAYTYSLPGNQEQIKFYPSPLPKILPDIPSAHTNESMFSIPIPGDDTAVKGLQNGALTGAIMLPGFPSLQTIDFVSELAPNGIKVFEYASKADSVLLNIQREISSKTNDDIASYALDLLKQDRVFINYPNLIQSKAVAVSTGNGLYVLNGNSVELKPFKTTFAKSKWDGVLSRIIYDLSSKKGIKAKSDILVHVLPIRGMIMKPDGSLVRNYSPENQRQPTTLVDSDLIGAWPYTHLASLVLTVDDVRDLAKNVKSKPKGMTIPEWADNPKFREASPQTLQDEFKLGQKIFYLKEAQLYGIPGFCLGFKDNNVLIRLVSPKYKQIYMTLMGLAKGVLSNINFNVQKQLDFYFNSHSGLGSAVSRGAELGISQDPNDGYIPSYVLAKKVGLSGLTLSKITSMIIVDAPGNKVSKFKIGLQLKLDNKGLCVPGYARRGKTGWEYSEAAVELVQAYRNKFGAVLQRIEANSKLQDYTPLTLSFLLDGGLDITSETIHELHKWIFLQLKNLPELESVESAKYTKAKVQALEKKIDEVYEYQSKLFGENSESKVFVINKKFNNRDNVLRPQDVTSRLTNQSFSLGDRIVVATEHGTPLALGTYGYVIGINAKSGMGNPFKSGTPTDPKQKTFNEKPSVHTLSIENLEILLDISALSGSELNGLCSPHRGYYIQPEFVLNLSSKHLASNSPRSAHSIITREYNDRNQEHSEATHSLSAYPPPKNLTSPGNTPNFRNTQNKHSGNNGNAGFNSAWTGNQARNLKQKQSNNQQSSENSEKKGHHPKHQNNNASQAQNQPQPQNQNQKQTQDQNPAHSQNLNRNENKSKPQKTNTHQKQKSTQNQNQNQNQNQGTGQTKTQTQDRNSLKPNIKVRAQNKEPADKPATEAQAEGKDLIPKYVKYSQTTETKTGKMDFKTFFAPLTNPGSVSNANSTSKAKKDDPSVLITNASSSSAENQNEIILKLKNMMAKANLDSPQ